MLSSSTSARLSPAFDQNAFAEDRRSRDFSRNDLLISARRSANATRAMYTATANGIARAIRQRKNRSHLTILLDSQAEQHGPLHPIFTVYRCEFSPSDPCATSQVTRPPTERGLYVHRLPVIWVRNVGIAQFMRSALECLPRTVLSGYAILANRRRENEARERPRLRCTSNFVSSMTV